MQCRDTILKLDARVGLLRSSGRSESWNKPELVSSDSSIDFGENMSEGGLGAKEEEEER